VFADLSIRPKNDTSQGMNQKKSQLSPNLSVNEVVRSSTAKRLGIDNTPSESELDNLKRIALNVFQPVRDHLRVPLYVSSGYRSPELNAAIGGSKSSQHMLGQALDIDCDVLGGVRNGELFHYIKDNLNFDQLIWEFGDEDNPDWVHVSYVDHTKNRNRCLQAFRSEDGKTQYKVIC
jgi:zinc D-Ala-D-Ala carboxypeptidase